MGRYELEEKQRQDNKELDKLKKETRKTQRTINNMTPEQKKKYMDVIGETALNLTSKDAQGFGNKPFNPQGSIDTTSPNGALPGGEVGMDQIMGLMTNK